MAWVKKSIRDFFTSGYGRLSFIHTAAVATKFHIIPHALPFLAPSKRPTTGHTEFLGKMLFFYTFHGFW
jgi:hypothetical protein